MMYKPTKSSAFAALFVLSTAMMHHAAARQPSGPQKVIHHWISPLGMVVSGVGIVYTWIKGNPIHPNLSIYTAMGLNLSVIANYFTRDKPYHTKGDYGPVVIPLLLLSIYLTGNILPKLLNQKAYFGLDKHCKLSKKQVNIGA